MNELVPQGTEAIDWSVEPDGPVMLPGGTGLFDVTETDVVGLVAPVTATPMGRPYAFTETKQAEYLDRIREGDGRDLAAYNVNVAPNTVRAHRRRFPEFEEQILVAESVRNGRLVSAAFKAAESGNASMLQFLLKNWMPDEFKERSAPAVMQQINTGPSIEWTLTEARAEAHAVLDEIAAKRAEKTAQAIDAASTEVAGGD